MADHEMKRVDMSKVYGSLNDSDKHFVRKLEKMNLERASSMKSLRKKNLMTGLLIGAGVLGIYFYSMYAVRQEKFLEGFDTAPEEKKAS